MSDGNKRKHKKKNLGKRFHDIKTFAKEKNLNYSYLNLILNKRRRYNEDFLNKIAEALEVPIYELLSDVPLIPYSEKEPQLHFNSPEGEYEGIKLFEDTISLGPGYELNQIAPIDYVPILKKFLPKGYKSDKDRIVAFYTKGISMKPTINDGSIVWIDRLDVIPKEGEIYAFILKDYNNMVTIKRLIKIDGHFLIIDGDNKNEEDRKTEELKDYPMVLNLQEYTEADISPVRGRVIWVLNRLIEKPKKHKKKEA